MRLLNLCRFYLKEIVTSKLYMGMLLLFFITFNLRFVFRIIDNFGMADYGNLVGEAFVPLGISFLIYIVFFYRLFSNELAYGVQNFFSDSYLILLQKILALAIIHVTIQGVFITTQIGCLWAFYWVVDIPYTSFYLESAQFMYIYYLTSIFIAFVIGIVIAMLLNKSKISFAAIFVVWLLLGPLNTIIFSNYFRSIPSSSFQTVFYTTVQNISDVYRSYLGFDFSYGTLWKALAWFFFCVFLIGICSLKWCRISREKIRMVGTLIVAFVLFLSSVFIMAKTNSSAFQYADSEIEFNYYQLYTQKQLADLRYTIDEYEIRLGSTIEVKISFKGMETTTPSFQLHHAYSIEKILNSEGQAVKFERDGDIVHINSGVTNELTFIYQITEPSIQRNNMILTGSMGWYPKQLEHPIYQYNEQIEKLIPTFNPQEKIQFTLYSESDLVTNISKVANQYYQGEVSSLFLLQADVNVYEFDKYTVIYPLDWSENKTQFSRILELAESVHSDLRILGIDVPDMPEKFVFQSNTGLGQLNDRILIYPTDSLYPIDSPYTTYLTPKKFVEAFVIDANTYYEWANIASNILAFRYNLNQDGILNTLPNSFIWLSEQEKAIATKIYSIIYEAESAIQNDILQKWYENRELLKNDWVLIEQFIGEEISGGN